MAKSEMTDAELIDYCDIHAETDRALFCAAHITRMFDLAGLTVPSEVTRNPKGFWSMHDDMKALVKAARARSLASSDTPPSGDLTKVNALDGCALRNDGDLAIIDDERRAADVIRDSFHFRQLLINDWRPVRWENPFMPGCIVETPLEGDIELRSLDADGKVAVEVRRAASDGDRDGTVAGAHAGGDHTPGEVPERPLLQQELEELEAQLADANATVAQLKATLAEIGSELDRQGVPPQQSWIGRIRELVRASRRDYELPPERDGLTHHFVINAIDDAGKPVEIDGYVTHNPRPDGTLGEFLVRMGRDVDPSFAALFQNFSVVCSTALEHGVSLETLTRKLVGQSYAPAGRTRHLGIRHARSVVDYVFRYLRLIYLPEHASAAGDVILPTKLMSKSGDDDA